MTRSLRHQMNDFKRRFSMLQCFMASDSQDFAAGGQVQNFFGAPNLQTQMWRWNVSVGAAGTLDPQLELGTSREHENVLHFSTFCTLKCFVLDSLSFERHFCDLFPRPHLLTQLLNLLAQSGPSKWQVGNQFNLRRHLVFPSTLVSGRFMVNITTFTRSKEVYPETSCISSSICKIIVYHCRLPSRPRHSLLLSDLGALLPGQGTSDVSQQFSI